jgi:hypothetical protein
MWEYGGKLVLSAICRRGEQAHDRYLRMGLDRKT